jgi:hypothetical protein
MAVLSDPAMIREAHGGDPVVAKEFFVFLLRLEKSLEKVHAACLEQC